MADIGKIQQREITKEMQESYLDYAMSVIVARALPDVRDGLKPVHRRILFVMHEMGLRHNVKFVKCANIVGAVLGRYHPHGDTAVYDSLVRMAQDFSLRYPLIQGQGNFGSIDGDSAAAYRYTEARLTSIAEEMLKDIEKETVPFADNYDGTKKEPIVLPSNVPNLLLNGTLGIAVGMATNIPPHNLTEVVDALSYLIENPKATSDDLMDFIKGPDFPTGGFIYNEKEIRQAYITGHGAILNRANAEIKEKSGEKSSQIVITEIPYQVNKSELLEKIAELVKEKHIEGIADIRDESDKEGLRIAIDLKRDAFPQKILNRLYKFTDLEKNFNLNMLALVDEGRQPQTLSIKGVLEEYLKHRNVVITKRSQFDLARAKERAHILEGLKKALDHIDAVISTIKKSPDKETAHKNLMSRFKLSEAQATAILEMRLSALAGLERQKIEDELKEKLALIKNLEALLKDPKKILQVVKNELLQIKDKYGDERKTKLVKYAAREIAEEDLIPEEEAIIVLTKDGYIKRVKPESYRLQKRGGKGTIGMETKEEDVVTHFITANTHSDLLFFTNYGKVYQIKAYEVPEGTRVSKGKAIFNFLSLNQNEAVTSVLAAPLKGEPRALAKKEKKAAANNQLPVTNYLIMATKNGIIKKAEGTAFEAVRKSGLIAIKLKKDDTLQWVKTTSGKDEIILATKLGKAIRFAERDVRPMGRNAAGVKAIRIGKGDEVIGMDIINLQPTTYNQQQISSPQLLIVMENGYGKRSPLKQYKKQRRGGSGIKTAKVTAKTGSVVSAKVLNETAEEIVAISQKGQAIRIPLSSIPVLGRATQGVRIMKMEEKDKIASITTL